MTTFSTRKQLAQIVHYLTAYMKIPYFQDDTVPGKVMEKIISLVHNGEQLSTYDYVDVCINGKIGWQVKSTKDSTPLTWKRAKIANSNQLIKESENGDAALKTLGDAIIDLCNNHAAESMRYYNLNKILYSRLIMFGDNTAIYFERLVCTKELPVIFDRDDYFWHWSTSKLTTKKEQLPALHGIDKKTQKKAFSWHGRGENQLHFTGEKEWWPEITIPTKTGEVNYSIDSHAMAFKLPTEKASWDALVSFLNTNN